MWGQRLVKKNNRSIKNKILEKKKISHPGFISSFCLSVCSSTYKTVKAKYFDHILRHVRAKDSKKKTIGRSKIKFLGKKISHPGFISSFCPSVCIPSFQKNQSKIFWSHLRHVRAKVSKKSLFCQKSKFPCHLRIKKKKLTIYFFHNFVRLSRVHCNWKNKFGSNYH